MFFFEIQTTGGVLHHQIIRYNSWDFYVKIAGALLKKMLGCLFKLWVWCFRSFRFIYIYIHEHSAASKTWSRLKWHGCWTQLNKRSIIDFVIPQEIFKKKEEGRYLPWKQLGWHENRPFKKSRYIVLHFPSWQLMNIGQFSSQPRIWQESKPLGTAPAAIHFPWKSTTILKLVVHFGWWETLDKNWW